jgi:hypothetical protein
MTKENEALEQQPVDTPEPSPGFTVTEVDDDDDLDAVDETASEPELPEHLQDFVDKYVDPRYHDELIGDPDRLDALYQEELRRGREAQSLLADKEAREKRAAQQKQAQSQPQQKSDGALAYEYMMDYQAQLQARVDSGAMSQDQMMAAIYEKDAEVKAQLVERRFQRQQEAQNQIANYVEGTIKSIPEFEPYRDQVYSLIQRGVDPDTAFSVVGESAQRTYQLLNPPQRPAPPQAPYRGGSNRSFVEGVNANTNTMPTKEDRKKEKTKRERWLEDIVQI